MSQKKKGGRMSLVVQAICAAEANIVLAKQMLSEMHGGQLPGVSGKVTAGPAALQKRESFRDKPGITGTFDGEYMVTEDKKKFEVNKNYASKSMLVHGDTLKMVKERDRNFFKQIDRVKRRRVDGVLVKKDGKWCLVTSDGSYKLLDEAVSYHKGAEGAEAVGVIPQDNVKAPFAALEKVSREGEEKESKKKEEKAPAKPAKGRSAVGRKPAAKATEKKEPAKKSTAKKPVAKKSSTAKKTTKSEKKETKPAAKKSSKSSEAPGKDELR